MGHLMRKKVTKNNKGSQWEPTILVSLFILDVATQSQKDHKLFSATYILCNKKIGNKKIEGSPLGQVKPKNLIFPYSRFFHSRFLSMTLVRLEATTPLKKKQLFNLPAILQ